MTTRKKRKSTRKATKRKYTRTTPTDRFVIGVSSLDGSVSFVNTEGDETTEETYAFPTIAAAMKGGMPTSDEFSDQAGNDIEELVIYRLVPVGKYTRTAKWLVTE